MWHRVSDIPDCRFAERRLSSRWRFWYTVLTYHARTAPAAPAPCHQAERTPWARPPAIPDLDSTQRGSGAARSRSHFLLPPTRPHHALPIPRRPAVNRDARLRARIGVAHAGRTRAPRATGRALPRPGRVRDARHEDVESAGRGDRDRAKRLGDLHQGLWRALDQEQRAGGRAHALRHRIQYQVLHGRRDCDARHGWENGLRCARHALPAVVSALRPMGDARGDHSRRLGALDRARTTGSALVWLELVAR